MTDDSEQERWTDDVLSEQEWQRKLDELMEMCEAGERYNTRTYVLPALMSHDRALRRLRGGEGERCEKCGSDDINTRHEEADRFRRSHRCQDTYEEHLHQTCRNCGWGWCEPTLSPTDGQEGPEVGSDAYVGKTIREFAWEHMARRACQDNPSTRTTT